MPRRPASGTRRSGPVHPAHPFAELVTQMRASVVLFASLTMLAPCELRAEPSLLPSLTSPSATKPHPRAPIDFRWGASNGSTWLAGWVALLWRREPSRFTERAPHPGAPADLLWGGSNSSPWFAGWVVCSSAASDTKDCTQFDPVGASTWVAELAFPKLWTAIETLPFGQTDGPAALFVAATSHGAPSSGGARRGDSPSMFDDDTPQAPETDAMSRHPTDGWPMPDRHDDDNKAITSTPEPATLMLAASGFAALAGVVRRRRGSHLE